MPIENIIRVVHQKPIEIPPLQEDFSNQGFMALSTLDGEHVLGRKVPQNAIFKGLLNDQGPNLILTDTEVVLRREDYPLTEEGKPVTGYEDPTLLSPDNNPLFPGSLGMFCTRTYPKETGGGVYADLIYTHLNTDLTLASPPSLVLAARSQLAESLIRVKDKGIKPIMQTDMVKEAESIPQGILFEQADGVNSNIAQALIEGGKIVECQKFRSARQDRSINVSTAASPILLEDGRKLLIYNRQRVHYLGSRQVGEWGVTFMVSETNIRGREKWSAAHQWIIRAPQNLGLGPGDQLIAFASCVQIIAVGEARIHYHVNDNRLYEAVVEICPQGYTSKSYSIPV